MTVSQLLVSTRRRVSLRLVATEICWSLHVGENLGETLTISGDPLAGVSKWQFFVSKEVGWLTVEIGNVLLTRGASDRSEWLLREHGVICAWSSSWLLSKELHDFSDLFTELGKSLHNIIFIGKLTQNLVYHIFKFLHDSVFKFLQFSPVSLLWQLVIDVLQITIGLVSVSFELSSQPLKFFHTLVENSFVGTTSRLHIPHPLVKLSNGLSERSNLVFKGVLSASHHLEIVHRWEMQLIDKVFDLLNVLFQFVDVFLVVVDLFRQVS